MPPRSSTPPARTPHAGMPHARPPHACTPSGRTPRARSGLRGPSGQAFAALLLAAALAAGCSLQPAREAPPPASGQSAPAQALDLRVVTFNVSLYDEAAGGLIRRLEAGDDGARRAAAVLQRLRPDIVLLNEFDYDPDGRAAELFQRGYLEQPQALGGEALHYPYRYAAPVNTGVPSGLDLDGDGQVGGEGRARGNDAWGYGLHPGQYGMLVLSRWPIDAEAVRSFRLLKWSAMPDAAAPVDPQARRMFYPDPVWRQLRLSSKTHLDVPVRTPAGTVHALVSHPTPPVFDGPEDRNGARNADEIRLWVDYLDDAADDRRWLCDDAGRCGGLAADAAFVILGDLNNDPVDGDGRHDAIRALLAHPRVLQAPAPRSAGAAEAARLSGGANAAHRGDPAEDTGDFGPRVGNLRLDYAIPARRFALRGSGVFWPAAGDPDAPLLSASDHRAVWVDLRLPAD